MDQGEIEFFEKIVEESINVIIDAKFVGESSLGGSRPLTIFFDLIPMANILGIGGMTRCGRCYALVFVETTPLNPTKELPKQKKIRGNLRFD